MIRSAWNSFVIYRYTSIAAKDALKVCNSEGVGQRKVSARRKNKQDDSEGVTRAEDGRHRTEQ